MLVLTRRTGETVVIGREVKVTVLGIKGDQTKLGIAAPKSVVVDREEIHERKLQEQGAHCPPPGGPRLKRRR